MRSISRSTQVFERHNLRIKKKEFKTKVIFIKFVIQGLDWNCWLILNILETELFDPDKINVKTVS